MEIGIHDGTIFAWTRERWHNLSHGEALTCNLSIKGYFLGMEEYEMISRLILNEVFFSFFFLLSDEKFVRN